MRKLLIKSLSLKVGTCPNDDNFVQICFGFFCVVIKLFDFLNAFLPRKSQAFAGNSCFFVCLFP